MENQKAAFGVLLILIVLASSFNQRTEGTDDMQCFGNCDVMITCRMICKEHGYYSATAKIIRIPSGGSKCCCVILA